MRRLMRFSSDPCTVVPVFRRRLRLEPRVYRLTRQEYPSRLREPLYQRVTLTAGGAPLPLASGFVPGFALGGRVLSRGHYHDHVAPVEVRLALYLPHVDVDLLFAGGLAGLLFLVPVLAVVHDADYGGVRVRRHLHQVE